MVTQQPSRGVWIAWALAFVGGLAVLAGVVLVLNDPCVDAGEAVRSGACSDAELGAVTALVFGGTGAAVVGGATAAVLTVRDRR